MQLSAHEAWSECRSPWCGIKTMSGFSFFTISRYGAFFCLVGVKCKSRPGRSRKTVSDAERGYKEINYRAMKLLPRGGYLATASCSHFMPSAEFEHMLVSSAEDAQVKLRQIEVRQQSPDHPVLWNVPETEYLKFYIFQIV